MDNSPTIKYASTSLCCVLFSRLHAIRFIHARLFGVPTFITPVDCTQFSVWLYFFLKRHQAPEAIFNVDFFQCQCLIQCKILSSAVLANLLLESWNNFLPKLHWIRRFLTENLLNMKICQINSLNKTIFPNVKICCLFKKNMKWIVIFHKSVISILIVYSDENKTWQTKIKTVGFNRTSFFIHFTLENAKLSFSFRNNQKR